RDVTDKFIIVGDGNCGINDTVRIQIIFNSEFIHQSKIPYQEIFSILCRFKSVSGNFLYIPQLDFMAWFSDIFVNGSGNGMRTMAFQVIYHFKHFLPVKFCTKIYFLNFENTFGHSPGLIHYYVLNFGEGIQKVTSLKQDTVSACRSDTSEITQRDRNYQGTGTRDYKEYQGPI